MHEILLNLLELSVKSCDDDKAAENSQFRHNRSFKCVTRNENFTKRNN
jgi:hypothetical protein